MTRLYLLDTGTVSSILTSASRAARARLIRLGQDEAACVSAVTAAELWCELERIGGGDRRRRALGLLLDRFRVLPWGGPEAIAYGEFRSHREAIGHPLGPLDTQIAAHAIAVRAVLVSGDAAFRHVHGLPGVESWTTDLEPGSNRAPRTNDRQTGSKVHHFTGWLRSRLARLRVRK
ncbi:MAG: PIN domain-containing protein [Terracidiphilus sp.]|jgi:tRNA(fMet)-specific endonuclease VapC